MSAQTQEIEELSRLADMVVMAHAVKTGSRPDLSTTDPLRASLAEAINARGLIESEQEKLLELYEQESDPTKREYILYQRELVALQLNRAADSAEHRLRYLNNLKTPEDWERENDLCQKDTLHWFNQWAWSLDPREDSPLAVTPFVPFDFQKEAVESLETMVFLERTDGVWEKSREQGATYIVCCWSVKQWRYHPHFLPLFTSKNEDAVDSTEKPDTLFEKMRFQIRLLPRQMLPKGFDYKKHTGHMKIANPENGSVITGEAPTQRFGRSGRYTVIFFDEHAWMPFGGYPQWTGASAASKSKLSLSSVQGERTKQAELAKRGRKGKIKLLTLKWDLHPWKTIEWYRGQSLTMEDEEIAQEIDIDYTASQPGIIYKAWADDGDNSYHIITWEQFKSVFGKAYIPEYWPLSVYQDVGTTPDHPTATGWYTRPAENASRFSLTQDGQSYSYKLDDTVFLYRSMTVFDMEIGDIWGQMLELMKPLHERERVRAWKISHEGGSERLTYRKRYGVQWQAWTPGVNRGITEMKASLKIIDKDKPNPFKPWLMGRPTFLIIVPGEQYEYDDAVDDFGHKRFREEIRVYHYPKQVEGEAVQAKKPYAFFNDQMDQSRIAAADGFVPKLLLNANEKREERLRPEIQLPAIVAEENPDIQQAKLQTRDLQLKRFKAEEEREAARLRKMAIPKGFRFRR